MPDDLDTTDDFERAAEEYRHGRIVLRLYVAGNAYQSARAIERVKQICEGCYAGRYDLEVIALYHQPALAQRDQIVALPTLIKLSPPPSRRVVGDMTSTERILEAIGVQPDE